MKKILLIIGIISITSCRLDKIVVTDLNTSGKVVDIKRCKGCMSGDFIYKVRLNPDTKIEYITSAYYEVGDYIEFKTEIK